MKSEQEFKQYYEQNLFEYLKNFDKKRIILRNITYINITLFLSLFISGYFILELTYYHPIWLLTLIPVVVLMIFLAIRRFNKKKIFRDEFKREVIKKIITFIDENLSYDYQSRISDTEFYKSKIFTTSADRSRGEDLIYGKIDKTDIKFSELHLEYKTTSTDSNGNTREQWHTIFKGVFFIADFNKHFNTETIVLPDGLERVFGKFARKLQNIGKRKGKKLIHLENPEFEKYFKVYADDEIESRYLLTPALMDRILTLKKTSNIKISFSFIDSNIYMALPILKNLFEPRIFNNNYSYEFLKESFSYLITFISIVDELNLNTRIWTKK